MVASREWLLNKQNPEGWWCAELEADTTLESYFILFKAFLGKRDELHLSLGDGTDIPLSGEWKGKVAVDARPPHALPAGFENLPTMPGRSG